MILMNFEWFKRIFHSQIFRYFLAGVSVTVLNIGAYSILLYFGMEYKTANLLALLLSKSWGFISNKFFVFKSHKGPIETLREIITFVFARGFTALIDYLGLFLLVEQVHVNKHISKYIITTMVIIMNYLLSKFVFDYGNKKESTVE